MSELFSLVTARLTNYRLFTELEVSLHDRLTVIHAENAGGKTALLSGLAVALGAALYEQSGNLGPGDVRQQIAPNSLTRSPNYPCRVEATGVVAGQQVQWARALTAPARRTTNAQAKDVRAAFQEIWEGKGDWPVVAFYGTQRLWGVVKATARKRGKTKRTDGYVDALDPRSKERQLLEWLFRASMARIQRTETPGELVAFERALAAALSHESDRGRVSIEAVEYDVANDEPILRATGGVQLPWWQLSDGYHVFAGLVADLARRCVTLNPHLGEHAVEEACGVVLIDEIDLHLHPRWQRVVVPGLLSAFPRLQFVISTHSPQVLSSVENNQVRALRAGKLVDAAPVKGRDTNSILREAFETTARDEQAPEADLLVRLSEALQREAFDEARPLLEQLRASWGDLDPEVIRASRLLHRAKHA